MRMNHIAVHGCSTVSLPPLRRLGALPEPPLPSLLLKGHLVQALLKARALDLRREVVSAWPVTLACVSAAQL